MISIKTKVKNRNHVKLPQLKKSHLDSINDARAHPKLGGLINSVFAESAIDRYVFQTLRVPRVIDLDRLPINVEAEEGGFLTVIRILDKVAE